MLVLLVAANAFGFVIAINSIEAKHKKVKRRKKEPLLVEEIKPEIRPKEESKIIKEVKEELAEIKKKKEIEEFEKEAKILQKAEEAKRREEKILEFKKEARILKEAEEKIKEIKKRYSPGKFVGSKNSNKYHAPKCDWAKRIKKKQRIWFNSEAEARRKGYSKHSCLK